MLPAKFSSIWPSGFSGEDFWKLNQSELRIANDGYVSCPIGTKWKKFIKDLP